MIDADASSCRLCLVTPIDPDPANFAPRLASALAGGDVASVIIHASPVDADAAQRIAEVLVPVIQAGGAAALVHNDTRLATRTGADGVHVDTGPADLGAAVAKLRPKLIVGAGGIRSRHDAMTAGETDLDYVFFGRLDGDTRLEIFPKALEIAEWWSSMMTIPAIVMGGSAIRSVRQAADAGIEFVALARAVWDHPEGPGAAVAEATAMLAQPRATVA
jgi:thiamine-phosphate pyrophosphorylase